MQPILTADSFGLNSGHFVCHMFCAGCLDAVKTDDDRVSAPGKAWHFLQSESLCRVRSSQPAVPRVARLKERYIER